MSLIRNTAPRADKISSIPFSTAKCQELSGGNRLYYYPDIDSEVVKIELTFGAGKSIPEGTLKANLMNALFTSGTPKYNQKEIAERFDFYGAYLEREINMDHSDIAVYALRKFAIEVLEFLAEVLNDCTFPEDELNNNLRIRKQKYLISLEKVSTMSRRGFTSGLFQDHPYGRLTNVEDYDNVDVSEIRTCFSNYYGVNPLILAAGKVDDELIAKIENLFGKNKGTHLNLPDLPELPDSPTGRKVFEKKGSVQSALRSGQILFNRKHEDYAEMQVLNTLLGGYFGSRLMSNLREDKGFTYGVGSGFVNLKVGGYFFISTEVGAEVTKLAENEIDFELNKLRHDLVEDRELDTVRNYMLGKTLRSTDGVFAQLDRFKSLHQFGLTSQDFHRDIEKISNVSAQRLRDLAQQYLIPEKMFTVVAGKG
ncbi:MAG: pitrilysin family protein [Vicingaceae bacterium]